MLGTTQERLKELDALYPVWEKDTLWTRFRKNAERFGEREFFAFEDCSYTYEETLSEVNAMAGRLRAIGIKEGNHVCLFMRNCPEYIFLIFALSKVGAVEVAGNARVSALELQHILKLSDSDCIISNVAMPPSDEPFVGVRYAVLPDPQKGESQFAGAKITGWDEFMHGEESSDNGRPVCPDGAQDPDGLSAIFFTSGSTSLPKGVRIRHDMVLRSAYATCRTRRMEIGRRAYLPLPLFHMRGFVEGLLALMMVGGTVIMRREKFSPEKALDIMRDCKVNDIICLSPMMVNILSRCQINPEDYPMLHAGSWSATCPEWVWDAARKAFGITDVTTSYGMTETGSSFTMVYSDDPEDVVKRCHGRLKSAGSASAPGLDDALNEMKIADTETGEEVPNGTVGELWFRGLTITDGYYNDPEATRAAITGDGWFKSGDKGVIDENGYFTFLGRKDDMYKINGENVSPLYLDGVISKCPLVNTAETVGIYHPKYGAVGVAFIDAKDGSEETQNAIHEYVQNNLACYQIPKYIFYSRSDTWPHTNTGKISKRGLRILARKMIEKTA